jgi:small-conductance mechanosensitive channel
MPPAAVLVSRVLELVYLGHTVRAWVTAAGVAAGVFAVLLMVRRVLVGRLARVAPRTQVRVDDVALAMAQGTRTSFLLVVALAAGGRVLLALPPRVQGAVGIVAQLALYLQGLRWANIAVDFWLARALRERAEHDKASVATLNLLGVVARVALWVLLVLLTLDAFGVNVTTLITGLGIAGVAVALAVQNVLGDLLASLSIALDKPFVVGDAIAFDTFNGTVENIGLKTTRLRSISGEQIVVANAELLKARIRNYQRQAERRVQFTLTFPLGTPPAALARVPAIVREVVTAEAQVRFDRSHVSAITDQAVAVETVYMVTSAEYGLHMDIQQRVFLTLLDRLAAADLALAAPPRSVLVRGDAGDGAPPPPPTAPGAPPGALPGALPGAPPGAPPGAARPVAGA